MDKILITHHDLDGLGCLLMFPKGLFDIVHHIGYDRIDSLISQFEDLEDPVTLYVTDLNFTPTQLTRVMNNPKVKRFFYIDHHLTHTEEDEKIFDKIKENQEKFNTTIIHDHNKCGTLLCADFVREIGVKLSDAQSKFAELVDVYDRWVLDSPYFEKISYRLNDLFWVFGFEGLRDRLLENGFNIKDPIFLEAMKSVDERRNKHLRMAFEEHSIVDENFLIIHHPTPDFHNDFVLKYKQFDFFLILKGVKEDKVEWSFRINERNRFELKDFVKEFKKYDKFYTLGGHRKAGGCSCKIDEIEEFVENFLRIRDLLV